MSELKPCPFCGGEAVPVYSDKGSLYTSNILMLSAKGTVKCKKCEVRLPRIYSRVSKAIEAWNKRVDDTQKDLYEQELYGYNLHDLLVFAVACRRASVDCNDLKTFSNNCEFAYAAIQNEWERSMNQAIHQMVSEQVRVE